MKLDTKVRTLGPVDHEALRTAACNLAPEVWLEDKMRQKSFDVHAQTQSVVLLFADGWPQVTVSRRSGWDHLAEYATPVMNQVINTYFSPGGTVIRAMVAKLIAGGVISEHTDGHPSFGIAHRLHVPLITNDQVDFVIEDEIFHFKEGIAYELSNLDYHSVTNRSAEDRLHLIFDYVPGVRPA